MERYVSTKSDARNTFQGLRCIGDKIGEQVPFASWFSIVSELSSDIRVRAKFTLKKKDYTTTVSKIHENNILLSRLVDHSSTFEPTRRANSRAKLARKIRTLVQYLFSALCKALCCRCIDSHRLGIHLLPRPGEDKDTHDSCVSFDMIFGSLHELQQNTSVWEGLNARWKGDECNPLEQNASTGIRRPVDILSLKDIDAPGQKGKSSLQTGIGVVLSKLNRSPSPSKFKRRVKVAFSISAAPTPLDKVSSNEAGNDRLIQSIPVSHITNLCAEIRQGGGIAKQPFGFIPCDEEPKRFDLYHHDSMPSSSDSESFTLREALSGKDGLMEFELGERLNIALALSFSILQLCNTSWLGKTISLDDIVFLRAADATRCYTQRLDSPAPFLVRQSRNVHHKGKPLRPVNFALLSLGVLLTHIIMGRPVEDIDLNEDMSKELLYSRKKLAGEKVATCDDASENYVGAVQWCFSNCFTFATLEEQELSRDFHDAVIARLEHDLRSIDYLRVQ